MAALRNLKHEVFARSIAAGLTVHAAYSAAGFTAKDARVANANGSRLMRNDNVKARIAELRDELLPKIADAMHLDAEFVTSRLMSLSQGRIPDGDAPLDEMSTGPRLMALSKLGEVLGIFKAPAVADAETAARALAKQLQIPLEEARARIAEAERFAREHA